MMLNILYAVVGILMCGGMITAPVLFFTGQSAKLGFALMIPYVITQYARTITLAPVDVGVILIVAPMVVVGIWKQKAMWHSG